MKMEGNSSNQNDNAEFIGDVYIGVDEYGDKSRRLQYRDVAHRLIEKYLPASFKNYSMIRDGREATIVTYIDAAYQADKKYGRGNAVWIWVDFLASALCVPRIKMYNDHDLPEFMQGYQWPEELNSPYRE